MKEEDLAEAEGILNLLDLRLAYAEWTGETTRERLEQDAPLFHRMADVLRSAAA